MNNHDAIWAATKLRQMLRPIVENQLLIDFNVWHTPLCNMDTAALAVYQQRQDWLFSKGGWNRSAFLEIVDEILDCGVL